MEFRYTAQTGLTLFLSVLSAGIARHVPSQLPCFTADYKEEMHQHSFSGKTGLAVSISTNSISYLRSSVCTLNKKTNEEFILINSLLTCQFYLTPSESPSVCTDHHLTRFYLFSDPSAPTLLGKVCALFLK